jgi:hypothetical protein
MRSGNNFANKRKQVSITESQGRGADRLSAFVLFAHNPLQSKRRR